MSTNHDNKLYAAAISETAMNALDLIAKRQGLSRSQILRSAVECYQTEKLKSAIHEKEDPMSQAILKSYTGQLNSIISVAATGDLATAKSMASTAAETIMAGDESQHSSGNSNPFAKSSPVDDIQKNMANLFYELSTASSQEHFSMIVAARLG